MCLEVTTVEEFSGFDSIFVNDGSDDLGAFSETRKDRIVRGRLHPRRVA